MSSRVPSAGRYPRPLTPLEGELIAWVLPEESPGYAPHREFVARSVVIGQGRRGEGEIVLGPEGARPDLDAPLPPVMSFGMARAAGDDVSVTVREISEGQMSVEIVGRERDAVDPLGRVERLWTYARWRPGEPCPQCGRPPRSIPVAGTGGVVLGICTDDRRIWVHDARAAVCRPIPVTNFHNELMLVKQIRDPRIALRSSGLFDRLGEYTDADLSAAFAAYNRVRTKVDLPGAGAAPGPRERRRLRSLLRFFLGG